MKINKPKKRNKYAVTKKDVMQNAKHLSVTMMVAASTQLVDMNASSIGDIFTACGGGPNSVCLWGLAWF